MSELIQHGRVRVSPEEASAREDAGESRLTTADRWEGLNVSLIRSGDQLFEDDKGQWWHVRDSGATEGDA